MKSKLPINQILTAVLLVTVLLMAFQNCSPTNFKQVDVASTAASASTPDPAAPPQQDIPVNNTLATPMYSLSIDPCLAGDDCVVHVTLDQTAAADFSFDWKTNDTAYLK